MDDKSFAVQVKEMTKMIEEVLTQGELVSTSDKMNGFRVEGCTCDEMSGFLNGFDSLQKNKLSKKGR